MGLWGLSVVLELWGVWDEGRSKQLHHSSVAQTSTEPCSSQRAVPQGPRLQEICQGLKPSSMYEVSDAAKCCRA